MRIRLALALSLAAAFAAPAARADARSDVEALMHRYQQAYRAKDSATIRSLLLPDFTLKPTSGRTVSRQEVLATAIREMKALKAIDSWSLSIDKFSAKGDLAVAVVRERMAATFLDAYGNPHKSVSGARLRQTFRHTAAGWRYQRVEEISAGANQDAMKFVPVTKLNPEKPEERAVRRAIEARYAVYQRAIRGGSLAGAMDCFTLDFSMSYPDGRTYNRRQMEASLRQTISATRSIPSWSIRVGRVSAGTDVKAIVSEDQRSVVADARGRSHSQHVMDIFVDTWVRTPKGWRLQNTQLLKADVTVDGKRVDVFRGRF